MKDWVRERCRNWVISDQPLGDKIIDPRFGCVNFSSGCQLSELVIPDVVDPILTHIEKRLDSDNYNGTDDEEEEEEVLGALLANTTLVSVPNGVDILPAELGVTENLEELDPNWL